jgi:hypothetical protein
VLELSLAPVRFPGALANELQLLTSMADQIGVAVENARLFAGMSDKSIALE